MNFGPLRSLLSERDYVVYITGTAISLTGTWIQRITIAWLVWEMTGSPFWVGLTAASDLLPTLVGALYGGVLADRLDRLRFLQICQVVCAVILCGLALAYHLDALTLGLLVGLRVCLSGSIALAHPTRMVLLVELVGHKNLNAAVSFGSVVFNIARTVGPALAGVLIAYGGFALALVTNALSFLAMAAAIAFIGRATPATRHSSQGESHVLGEIVLACRYITAHHAFSAMFLLYIAYVLTARAIEDLLPAFVETLFAGGVQSVAMLISVLGVGSIMGGVWASGRAMIGLTRTMLIAGALQAVSLAGLAMARNFPAACVLIFLVGFFTVQFGTAAQTLVQSSVSDAMRGRVMSLWFIILRGVPGLGALVMGTVAELVGMAGAFLAGAGGCLLACGLAWRGRRRLARDLER